MLLAALLAAVASLSWSAPPAGAAVDVEHVKVGKVTIGYYTRGSGPPLVMIMGFSGTMAEWDPALLDLLDDHYKLILFDNRGAGESTDTKRNNTTIPRMADDAAGLMKALGIRRAHVLGWSMGGFIAQQFVVRHPKRVRSLVLAGTDPGGTRAVQATPKVQKELENAKSDSDLEKLIFPPTAAGEAAAKALGERLGAAVQSGSIPNDFTVSRKTVLRQSRANGDLWYGSNRNHNALAKVKAPTLVAGGALDIVEPPENTVIIANRIRNSWRALFPGAGHAFLSQDWERFGNLVVAFLG